MRLTIAFPWIMSVLAASAWCGAVAALAPSSGQAQDDEAAQAPPGRGKRPVRPARTRGAGGPPDGVGRNAAEADGNDHAGATEDADERSQGRGEDVRARARQGRVRGDVRSPRGAEKAAAASGRSRRAAAWARLRRRAGVDRPADIPPPMRAELRIHARRTARLSRVIQVALEAGDEDAVARAQALQEKENARHERRLTALGAAGSGGDEDDDDVEETTGEIAGGGPDHRGGAGAGSASTADEETRR